MRIKNVIQLHTANRMTAYGWPFLVMLMALAIVLGIGFAIGTQGSDAAAGMNEGMRWNGAIFSILGPLTFFGFSSMSQYFPLAMGLGLTRKEFAAGSSLIFLGNAVVYSVLITIGKTIERATGGFGLSIRFFDVAYTGLGAPWQTLIQTFVLILAALFVGAAITTAANRWGQKFTWPFVLGLVVIAAVLGTAAIVSSNVASALWDVVTMGWWPWIGVAFALAIISAGIYLVLVRRTQLR